MRKCIPLLLLVSLAACSSTADSAPDGSMPSTSLAANPQIPNGTQDQTTTTNPANKNNNLQEVTIPLVTKVPTDLKSGEGRPLVLDQPTVLGVHQFAVSYANAIVNTISRHLVGAPVDMVSLLAAAEFQESNIPVVPNIKERVTTQLGESGIQVKGEFSNMPKLTFSIAYVCLVNGGVYTSLSTCAGS